MAPSTLASVMLVGSLVLSSCSRAPAPTSKSPPDGPLAVERQPGRGSVVGRVLLGGKPVPYFGVIFSTNYMTSAQAKPFAVHTSDGRFVINGIPPRSWDVIIVAPHHGTFMLPGREVTEGSVLDLGDIVMTRGRTIAGRVTDAEGRPVTDAKVRIVTSRLYPPTDELSEMSLGNFETRSNALGMYRFDGVTSSELAHFSSSIVATYGTLHASDEASLPHSDATIDLVLRDTGAIDGVVAFAIRPGATVAAEPVSRNENARYAQVGADRRFRFDNVQPDAYEIQLIPEKGAVPLPSRIVVESAKRSGLTIVAPAHAVTIAIQVTGDGCGLLKLTPVDASGAPAAMEQCSANRVEISGVTPARYSACVAGSCIAIDVHAQPDRQSFVLEARP